jgi:CheY-like chemotaxis protein
MSDKDDVTRRILVVDDNESIHQDFRQVLCPGGGAAAGSDELEAALFGEETPAANVTETFQIESAMQGQEAYQRLQEALKEGVRFAVAFVDMRMPPGWDGLETIQHLWEVDPQLQVVVCTAFADYSWDTIIERLGQSDQLLLLKKPFDPAEVWQLASALTQKWEACHQAHRRLE